MRPRPKSASNPPDTAGHTQHLSHDRALRNLRKIHGSSWPISMIGQPASGHFKDIRHWTGRGKSRPVNIIRSGGIRAHALGRTRDFPTLDPDNIQAKPHPLHPKCPGHGIRSDKQHPRTRLQAIAITKPQGLLRSINRKIDIQRCLADDDCRHLSATRQSTSPRRQRDLITSLRAGQQGCKNHDQCQQHDA